MYWLPTDPRHTVVPMPQIGPAEDWEYDILEWRVEEGDGVHEDDVYCEIETDKTVVEFHAMDEGFIAKKLVPEGVRTSTGSPILITVEKEEDVAAFANYDAWASEEEARAIALAEAAADRAAEEAAKELARRLQWWEEERERLVGPFGKLVKRILRV